MPGDVSLLVDLPVVGVQRSSNFRGECMSLRVGRAQVGAAVRKRFWACLLWCCLAAIGEARAGGQTAVDGAIGGFVVGAGGAALGGAMGAVENVAGGTMTRAATGSKGEFLVAHLGAGEYRVGVKYALFAGLTLQPVVVEVGGVTSVEARMRVGGVATSVTVRAEAASPSAVNVDELSSAAVGRVVTPDEIARRPVKWRRWQEPSLLMPPVDV